VTTKKPAARAASSLPGRFFFGRNDGKARAPPLYCHLTAHHSLSLPPPRRARATSLEASINAILDPVLDALPGAASSSARMAAHPPTAATSHRRPAASPCAGAAAAHLDALAAAVPAAIAAAAAKGTPDTLPSPEEAGAAAAAAAPGPTVARCLAYLNALERAAASAGLPCPPELFEVSAVDRLARLVDGGLAGADAGAAAAGEEGGGEEEEEEEEGGGASPSTQVPPALEPAPTRDAGGAAGPSCPPPAPPTAAASTAAPQDGRWSAWTRLAAALGARPSTIAVALSAPARAAVAEAHGAAAGPRRALRFTAVRGRVLAAIGAAAGVAGALDGGGAWTLRPTLIGGGRPTLTGRAAVVECFALAGRELAGLVVAGEDGVVGGASGGTPTPPFGAGLFAYAPSAGALWFAPGLEPTADAAEGYRLAGWLLAQSLAARAPLGGAPFPPLLFAKLAAGRAFDPTLEALAELDGESAAAIRAAAALRPRDYERLLSAQGLPLTTTRRAFERAAARELLASAVSWQHAALAAGWASAADRAALTRWRFTPADLAALVAGPGVGGTGAELRARAAVSDAAAAARPVDAHAGLGLAARAASGPLSAAIAAALPPPVPSLPPLGGLRKAGGMMGGFDLSAVATGAEP